MALPSTNVNYVTIDPFDYPDNNLDATGLYAAGDGFLAASSDGGQNWTNLTSGMGTPPNPHGDSPAPAASDLDYKFIVANPYSANEIVAQAEWTNGGGQVRSFVVTRNNALAWTWTAGTSDSTVRIDPDTAGISWLVNLDPADDYTSAGSDITTLTNNGSGSNAAAGTSPGAAPSFVADIGNSRRGVSFDATNFEYATFGTSLGRPANCTIFVAVNFLAYDTDFDFIAGSTDNIGADAQTWGQVGNDGGGRLSYDFGNGTNASYGSTDIILSTNTLTILAYRYTAGDTAYDIWMDAVKRNITVVGSSAASAQTGTAYDYSLGRRGEYHATNRYGDFEMGRMYLVDSALTNAQVEGISANLADYYDIAITSLAETRQLGVDVDRHAGTSIYSAAFDGADLILQKRTISTLSATTTTTLGAATLAQIAAYTYYANVFTPPATFGDSSTVYVFGRWDDGTVRHLQKSTDGGATLSDIGDSATWGADYISAFFATDANTFFAFRAGTTKALYRSQDGGSTWDNLGTLPFNVARASLGADGRIAICNRDASGAQVAVADGPLFATWTDISGTLPTGGKGSIVWA